MIIHDNDSILFCLTTAHSSSDLCLDVLTIEVLVLCATGDSFLGGNRRQDWKQVHTISEF